MIVLFFLENFSRGDDEKIILRLFLAESYVMGVYQNDYSVETHQSPN